MAFKKPENVPGLISNEDGKFLEEFAEVVPEGMCIVEIGAFTGKSTAFLGRGGAANNVIIYTYDLWHRNNRPITGRGLTLAKSREHSFDLFNDNMKRCGLNQRVFPNTTHSAAAGETWPVDEAQPIGLIYIDGDHRYPGVKADMAAWLPKLAKGAPAIFDDYFSSQGVRRAVDEWRVDNPTWHQIDITERFMVIQETSA